jgi:ribosomal protein S18 acetylase RimI-like enzyme
MGSVELRALALDDWALWRELRLHALAEAPYAFGSTLAEWTGSGDTEERWRHRLSSVPLNLVASLSGEPVGMASATSPVDDEVELISMWVAPEARGRAVGTALIEAIVVWALEQHVLRVALDVRETNVSAINLFERLSFVDVGLSPGSGLDAPERRMFRLLG